MLFKGDVTHRSGSLRADGWKRNAGFKGLAHCAFLQIRPVFKREPERYTRKRFAEFQIGMGVAVSLAEKCFDQLQVKRLYNGCRLRREVFSHCLKRVG